MAESLTQDELIDRWTVLPDELRLVGAKGAGSRLGFALLLKFFTWAGRFPAGPSEVPADAVGYVARQLSMPPGGIDGYDWAGRTAERHRAQIRSLLGFRECSVADADKLTGWLAEHVAEAERRPQVVADELAARCRAEHLEPPSPGRVERIVASALRQAEEALCGRIASRLAPEVIARMDALVAVAGDGGDEAAGSPLGFIRADPGNVSLESMLAEVDRLLAVRAVGLPATLFDDVASKVVAGWRARAAVEAPRTCGPTPLGCG